MVMSAVRACSGSESRSARPTPAWTLITEMLCARTSCSSRAIRSRSSSARRRAACARSARSRAHCSRRVRASSESATIATPQVTTTVSCPQPAASSPPGGSHRNSQCATSTCPTHSAPIAVQAALRCPATIALKQPMATVRNTGPYGYPAPRYTMAVATVPKATSTGRRHRHSNRAAPTSSRTRAKRSSSARSSFRNSAAAFEPTRTKTVNATVERHGQRGRVSSPSGRFHHGGPPPCHRRHGGPPHAGGPPASAPCSAIPVTLDAAHRARRPRAR